MSTQRSNTRGLSGRPSHSKYNTNPNNSDRIAQLVRFVNNTPFGMLRVTEIRDLFYSTDASVDNLTVWKFLKKYDENFLLDNEPHDGTSITGHEKVLVRTVLGLCKDHCSRKSHLGKSQRCPGNCGALHVCRVFLLNSASACPFNSKKTPCRYGHSFYTKHNADLLKEHHLNYLTEPELQQLFKRRPSRTETTMPKVCVYYNKPDGKQCTNEKCKSLHLCSDFVLNRCEGPCPLNHLLSTKQVKFVLRQFGLDQERSNVILTDIRAFTTLGQSSDGNDDDDSQSAAASDYDDSDSEDVPEESMGHLVGATAEGNGERQICDGCENLTREVKKMQLTVAWLTSQVKALMQGGEKLQMKKGHD